ncbi:MAG: sugar kinase [Chloroflexi bacterium]|nr:sugar kinase [Chloroflexota bacterium]
MVELFCDGPLAEATTFHKSFGGDTLNTLVAAARLGTATGYLTRVGDDPFAPYLLGSWEREGVDTSQARRVPGFNGLYFISLLAGGEREFTYYRAGSAASTVTPEDLDSAYLARARLFHTSGISQALSPTSRSAVLAACRLARAAGVGVSFDPNLRLRLWPSLAEARAALEEVLPLVTVALPSGPEEVGQLLGTTDPGAAVRFFLDRGVEVVALKLGAQGCLVASRTAPEPVAVPTPPVTSLDTTGAGDAFNGGLLHGLLSGLTPVQAALLGVATASLKVRGRGAIASLPSRQEAYALWEQRRPVHDG